MITGYASDTFDVNLETSRGMSKDAIVRLAYLDVLQTFINTLVVPHINPVPNVLRFVVEERDSSLRVMCYAERIEPLG